jgi:hypothetical protein
MNRPTVCWQKQPANAPMQFARLASWLINCVLWLGQIPVLILALVLILLSGCANTEPTPQYLREPVPQTWTDTFIPPLLNGTYGDYMAQCELIIQQCNADRISVRRWSDEATEEVEE